MKIHRMRSAPSSSSAGGLKLLLNLSLGKHMTVCFPRESLHCTFSAYCCWRKFHFVAGCLYVIADLLAEKRQQKVVTSAFIGSGF